MSNQVGISQDQVTNCTDCQSLHFLENGFIKVNGHLFTECPYMRPSATEQRQCATGIKFCAEHAPNKAA